MGATHWKTKDFVDFKQFDLFKLLDVLLKDNALSLDERRNISFKQNLTLSFQPQELSNFQVDDGQICISSNLLNILGLYGPLPDVYNELFIDERRNDNQAIEEFLDIFHHRLLTIAYRTYQQMHSSYISDIVLHLSPARFQNLHLNELFFKNVKTLDGLKQLLEEFFHLQVSVNPCKGDFVYPDPSNLNQLGKRYTTLGKNCLIGHRYFEPDLQCEIVIGPMEYDDFFELWSCQFDELKRLCFIYLPVFTTPRYIFKVKKHKASKTHLGEDMFLGINSWILSDTKNVKDFEVRLS